MIYRFIDQKGSFIVQNPHRLNTYFPLTNQDGSLLSAISPRLSGDIKTDNDHFLTPPASIEDLKSNLFCRREFFIKTNRGAVRASYVKNDTLEAGLLYHKLIKTTRNLQIEILNFIPHNLAVEVMQVKIRNISNQDLEITPTSFIPLFGRAEKNLRDHRHVSSLLNRIKLSEFGIYLKPSMIFDEKGHSQNKSIYFVLGYEGNGLACIGQFPTIDYFCGEGDLILPDAIAKDLKAVTGESSEFEGKEACAAFRFRTKKLKSGQESSYCLLMGIQNDARKISSTFRKLNLPEKISHSLAKTKEYWSGYLSNLEFDFKDNNFNNWLLWVKLQPTLRKLFGCSFLPHFDYGKGGRGWRDLWQDALALLLTEPDKAASLIVSNFYGVRIDGSNATIITKEGNFISDRNRISRVWMDHGVWPYLTLRLYLQRTGDFNLLFKNIPYFRDQQLSRAKEIDLSFSQKDYFLRTKSNSIYQGSVLEHLLLQNLIPFFNVGIHNIIRLENADWNDGLDMAARKGESVAFSFMYAHNLLDICSILEYLKKNVSSLTLLEEITMLLDSRKHPLNYSDYKAKQRRLEEYLEKTKYISGKKISIKIDDLMVDLKRKAEHLFSWLREREWLNEGFFNGYYDNQAKRVEGKHKTGMRMMLQSQVFAIASGGAEDAQIKKTWFSIRQHLFDKALGGFRLNTDFHSLCLDFGRAFGFSYGDKENGAFFNHMVVMLANALYKRGFVKEGSEVIASLYSMATSKESGIYPMIPEYFNSQGKGLYFYLTGSASWYIFTLLEEVLGVKFVSGNILIEPKLLPGNFYKDTIKVRFVSFGKIVEIIFLRPGKDSPRQPYAVQQIFLNGLAVPLAGSRQLILKEDLKKRKNMIKVFLR